MIINFLGNNKRSEMVVSTQEVQVGTSFIVSPTELQTPEMTTGSTTTATKTSTTAANGVVSQSNFSLNYANSSYIFDLLRFMTPPSQKV